jgi:hypothetical protein
MMPKTVRTALNRFSHAEGISHADATKQRLTAELEALRANGASIEQMLAYIATYKKEPAK